MSSASTAPLRRIWPVLPHPAGRTQSRPSTGARRGSTACPACLYARAKVRPGQRLSRRKFCKLGLIFRSAGIRRLIGRNQRPPSMPAASQWGTIPPNPILFRKPHPRGPFMYVRQTSRAFVASRASRGPIHPTAAPASPAQSLEANPGWRRRTCNIAPERHAIRSSYPGPGPAKTCPQERGYGALRTCAPSQRSGRRFSAPRRLCVEKKPHLFPAGHSLGSVCALKYRAKPDPRPLPSKIKRSASG